jgi:hypothetical protein
VSSVSASAESDVLPAEGAGLLRARRFIFFANRGTVRYPHHDDQTTQAHCHTLVVKAWVLSTTGYLEDAIDAHQADGHQVSDETKAHTSRGHNLTGVTPRRSARSASPAKCTQSGCRHDVVLTTTSRRGRYDTAPYRTDRPDGRP